MRNVVNLIVALCVFKMCLMCWEKRVLLMKKALGIVYVAMLLLTCDSLAIAGGMVTVTGVEAHQRYPWNGLVDVVVTLEGAANDVANVECSFAATNSITHATVSVSRISQNGSDVGSGATWMRRFVWDATHDVGAVTIDDLVLAVNAEVGVCLWKDGPYWARCNLGATKPEGYGYHFWWGDTVGYRRNADDSGWISVKDGTVFSFCSCPTYDKSMFELKSGGLIDSTGELAPAHDAATVNLGAPWRMPTLVEIGGFVYNCTTTKTVRNGVHGYLVSGKGDYASKNIFLPAAGIGDDSSNRGNDSSGLCWSGLYWSSTPRIDYNIHSWYLYFNDLSTFRFVDGRRYCGMSVRPVRGCGEHGAKTATGASTHLKLDCRTGARLCRSVGEVLLYDAAWYENGEQVRITDNGTVVKIGISGSYTWMPESGSPTHHELKLEVLSGENIVGTETAQFEIEGFAQKYTVKFDLGAHGKRTGGGELNQSVEEGMSAVEPAFDIESGWEFVGWSCEFAHVTTDLLVTALYRQVSQLPDGYGYTERIGDYTWTFSVINGEAVIGTRDGNGYECGPAAVSPAPMGKLIVPTTLGGCPVKKIGMLALSYCRHMTSVELPNTLCEVGDYAFLGSEALLSIEIPADVTEIDYWAFSSCSALSAINVVAENRFYSSVDGVLFDKDRDVLLCFPEGKARECAEYEIPVGVTRIGYGAFNNCNGLSRVLIPASVVAIEEFAFDDCSDLETIEVDADNKDFASVGGVLFSADRTELIRWPAGNDSASEGYAIPPGTLRIGSRAFDGCTDLKWVQIPSGVTDIGSFAFNDCRSLTDVTIPNGVVNIAACAFQSCTAIKSVAIPASVVAIGENAFYKCDDLRTVYVGRGDPSRVKGLLEGGGANTTYVQFVEASDADALLHRWSFNGSLRDSVGTKTAVAVGNVTIGARECVLAGGTRGSSYVDLGAGVMPADGSDATIEIWATQNKVGYWSRVFDFGKDSSSCVFLAWTQNSNIERDDFCIKGGSKDYAGLAPFTLGKEFHISVVFTKGQKTWHVKVAKRDAVTGEKLAEIQFDTFENWSLPVVGKGNFWLGHSQFGDEDASASYNEVRIWGRALSDLELNRSARLGPDEIDQSEIETCIVAFDANGGECETARFEVAMDSVVGKLPVATCDNYDFLGWFTAKDGGMQVKESTVVSENVTVYAHWRFHNGVTVCFDANGGLVDETIRAVIIGRAIGSLPIPTRRKYKFDGWYTTPSGGTKVTASTKVAADVTYYAHWTYDGSATVSVNVGSGCLDMGTVSGGKTAKAGTKITFKATAKSGYVFAGWYRDAEFDEPVEGDVDYRTPSYSYVVGEDDAAFFARFIPVYDDDVEIEWSVCSDFEPGIPIDTEMVSINVMSASLPTVKVSGLPPGLKFTAKRIVSKWGMIEAEANTIYGTPTKSGVYTVTVTATTVGKMTATEQFRLVVRGSNEYAVSAKGVYRCPLSACCCEYTPSLGAVSGSGVYAPGKTVTLKAPAAPKGQVFAGWYATDDLTYADDEYWWGDPPEDFFDDCWPVYGTLDYRNSSMTVTVGYEDVGYYALYMYNDFDTVLSTSLEGRYVWEGYDELPVTVESYSLPKISVSGLPAGLKFDSKKNMISGSPTKPGTYTVKLAISNQTIKKAISQTFEIFVPNLHGGADAGAVWGLDYGADAYTMNVAVANGYPELEVSADAKASVAGLPTGLKYDVKSGLITGVPTKAGTYTATITTIVGRDKYTDTVTIKVNALPSWAYGTFNGGSDYGQSQLTITSAGKLSGKYLEDGISYALAAVSFDSFEYGAYHANVTASWTYKDRNNKSIKQSEIWPIVVEQGDVGGCVSSSWFDAWQNVWTLTDWKQLGTSIFGKSGTVKILAGDEYGLEEGESITLTIKSNGTVTQKGVFDTGVVKNGKSVYYTASGSAVVCPTNLDPFTGKVFVYFAPNAAKGFEGYVRVVPIGE